MSADTIPARLFATAARLKDLPAFYERKDGQWQPSSWTSYAQGVRQAARALCSLGFKTGDNVCIIGFNRPEWVCFDLAAMTAGGAAAGIYTTSSAGEVQYILNHTDAQIVLIEDAGQWAKIEQKLDELPHLRHVILMRGATVAHPKVLHWEDFLAKAAQTPEAEVDRRLAALKKEDLATLIYTSGTTGPPKGVMLSHENLAWTASVAQQLVSLSATDSNLSYLPLSHIAEQMFTIHAPISVGFSVYYAESMERLRDNLLEVRPTVFFGVPRVWEKMYAVLRDRLAATLGFKARLATWARGVALARDHRHRQGLQPSFWLAAQYALANRLILSKIKAALGFSQARFLVSGAAPIAPDVLEFFASLDLPIFEVYGQSEDSGPTTFNLPMRRKAGTVGPPIPGVEVRLASDDEVLVRGPNVFLGYYKDPLATAATLKEGWLHSGDLGKFDSEGFLQIIGRKKEILITAGGKNIAPRNIEEALKRHPWVAEAVIIGDRRPYLAALLCLDAEKLAAQGMSVEKTEVRQSLEKWVETVNSEFARVEHIRRFEILPRLLSQEAGELTPTLKLKRNVIMRNWEAEIERLYAASTETS